MTEKMTAEGRDRQLEALLEEGESYLAKIQATILLSNDERRGLLYTGPLNRWGLAQNATEGRKNILQNCYCYIGMVPSGLVLTETGVDGIDRIEGDYRIGFDEIEWAEFEENRHGCVVTMFFDGETLRFMVPNKAEFGKQKEEAEKLLGKLREFEDPAHD